MSSENHGVPEDDDPFAYLYRGEGADGTSAQETAPLPGVPRTSYHQATQVGRTQYGQQPQAPQGYQPTASYQVPEQSYPQSPPYQQSPSYQQTPPPGGGRAGNRAAGGGGGGANRGVVLGAVAVVVAVVVVIAVVAFNSNSNKTGTAGGAPSSTAAAALPSASAASATPSEAATTGTVDPVDAATMTLGGSAKINNNHKNALAAGGSFVDGMTNVGASVTWNVTAPAKGQYFLWIRYANATGQDAGAALTVNQKPSTSMFKFKDYGSNGSWDSWFSSFRGVSLKKGQNTITLTCVAGTSCTFNLDQLALTPPTDSSSRPAAWK